jgi:glyoxylase-like metal-dependent hydrolase (beta-lactamase superfamily II)
MMSRVVLGDFEITLVRAGFYWWDGGAMFGVVPKTLWSKQFEPDDSNRVCLGFNCYVVRTGDRSILIETGAGDKPDHKARERMKLPAVTPGLPELLAGEGIDPESIDTVINTHLHFDHCGGNTVLSEAGAKPALPRARYYTMRGEWEHAHERHVRDRVSYVDANYDPLLETGQMRLLDTNFEVAPGIAMSVAPGHNRDMAVVTATSAGQTFCFFSDLIPTVAHVTPSWVAAFDLFPLQVIENKGHWLEEAVRARWICGFAHEPEVAFARIQKVGQSFRASAYSAGDHEQAGIAVLG